MDNRLSLRAMPIIAFARKFAFIFMLICSFNFNSIVFGADYIFNGETLPATSSYQDTYYGVETMQNILDDLAITYTDTTLLSYTYYANQALKFWRATYDENTTPLNIIFTKNSNNTFYMIPSNGTFDDDLQYLYFRTNYSTSSGAIHSFINWNYYNDGSISSASYGNIPMIQLTTSTYTINNTAANYVKNNTEDYQNGAELYYKYVLSPIESFTVAGYTATTGYSWYFLTNTIRFTEKPDVEIPSGDDGGDTGGGDTGGDTGGGTGSTDLTMTNAKIDQLNKHAEEIQKNMLTSGDMQQIVSNETDKVISFMSGDADFNKEYTSGEILEKIDFTPIENPTANFWYELTQILNNALTGSGGNVVFKWFGNEYTITPEMINPPYPEELRVLLTTVSTVVVIFIIAKWIKIIADTSQGGNLDQLLEMNEEGIVNLF